MRKTFSYEERRNDFFYDYDFWSGNLPDNLSEDWATEEDYLDFDTCQHCQLIIKTKKQLNQRKPKYKYSKIGFKNDEDGLPDISHLSFPVSEKDRAEKKLQNLNNLKAFW